MKPIPLAVLLICAALPAAAQTSWYAGFSAGQSKTDRAFIENREGAITNATNVASSFDDKDSAWKATLGWRLSSLVSLEAHYSDYGNVQSNTTFTTPGGAIGSGGVAIDRQVKGFGVDAVFSAPILERLSVFGRIGAFRAETEASASLAGDAVFSDGSPDRSRTNKSTETVAKYGVGLDWAITQQIVARLEYERLAKVGRKFETGASNSTGEADIDTVMLGVVFRF